MKLSNSEIMYTELCEWPSHDQINARFIQPIFNREKRASYIVRASAAMLDDLWGLASNSDYFLSPYTAHTHNFWCPLSSSFQAYFGLSWTRIVIIKFKQCNGNFDFEKYYIFSIQVSYLSNNLICNLNLNWKLKLI